MSDHRLEQQSHHIVDAVIHRPEIKRAVIASLQGPRPHLSPPPRFFVYVQSTGDLYLQGEFLGRGYSGAREARNRPSAERRFDRGPIPRGAWRIERAYNDAHRGRTCLALKPYGHDAWGRTDFLIHADSVWRPGKASTGCIVMGERARERIACSGLTMLLVVADRPKPGGEPPKGAEALAEALNATVWAVCEAASPGAREISANCAGFVYSQSSGELYRAGQLIGAGYSGLDLHKNNPDAEALHDRGPIPRGRWWIGPAYEHPTLGPICMNLTPQLHDARGRDVFMIHGDSANQPGRASNGGIILDRHTRHEIAASHIAALNVVR